MPKKLLGPLLALALFYAPPCPAQDAPAQEVLKRAEALRPGEEDFAMYRLDWADSLDAALARAAKENRPVALVIIHAKYGDLRSGHC